jgi:hypothetical protein
MTIKLRYKAYKKNDNYNCTKKNLSHLHPNRIVGPGPFRTIGLFQ